MAAILSELDMLNKPCPAWALLAGTTIRGWLDKKPPHNQAIEFV